MPYSKDYSAFFIFVAPAKIYVALQQSGLCGYGIVLIGQRDAALKKGDRGYGGVELLGFRTP